MGVLSYRAQKSTSFFRDYVVNKTFPTLTECNVKEDSNVLVDKHIACLLLDSSLPRYPHLDNFKSSIVPLPWGKLKYFEAHCSLIIVIFGVCRILDEFLIRICNGDKMMFFFWWKIQRKNSKSLFFWGNSHLLNVKYLVTCK